MATNELRNRGNWQTAGGEKAEKAEKSFFEAFQEEFKGTEYIIRSKPKDFQNIYVSVQLSKDVLDSIYCPPGSWKHGVAPDYAITNTKTGKTLYVEVKRQDGWVEGKLPKDGRGNAHERSCKFFTPGLLKVLRAKGKLGPDVLPFWVVFQGDIARDPKRVREVTLWFDGIADHFFMWGNSSDPSKLINHLADSRISLKVGLI
jgi:hypothetical protein